MALEIGQDVWYDGKTWRVYAIGEKTAKITRDLTEAESCCKPMTIYCNDTTVEEVDRAVLEAPTYMTLEWERVEIGEGQHDALEDAERATAAFKALDGLKGLAAVQKVDEMVKKAVCPTCEMELPVGLEGSHILRCSGVKGQAERVFWPTDARALYDIVVRQNNDLIAERDRLKAELQKSEQARDEAEIVFASARSEFRAEPLVDSDGQCISCWTFVVDEKPERHSDLCLIQRLTWVFGGAEHIGQTLFAELLILRAAQKQREAHEGS